MTQRSSIWLSLTLAERGNRVTQLCRVLRAAIEKGQLAPGERLPSSRQLATDLGCSRTTVEAAYQRLTTQGYLTRLLGQGSFVTQRGLELSSPAYQGLPPDIIKSGTTAVSSASVSRPADDTAIQCRRTRCERFSVTTVGRGDSSSNGIIITRATALR